MFASPTLDGPDAARPCPGFPVALLFPDVEPDVLAREAANEASRVLRPDASLWHAYLRRVVPALERHAPADMARALVTGGTGTAGSRAHAERMRRRAIAAGAVHRARFWAEVADEIGRV